MPEKLVETDPRKIDLAAWLGETRQITKTVTVYGRGDLVERINALEVELAGAAVRERSMSEKAPGGRRRELDELRETYEASALKVTVRARKLGDMAAIEAAAREAREDIEDQEVFNVYATSRWAVEPAMTVEQVRALADALGAPQFETIVAAWNELATKAPVPTVPLSPRL